MSCENAIVDSIFDAVGKLFRVWDSDNDDIYEFIPGDLIRSIYQIFCQLFTIDLCVLITHIFNGEERRLNEKRLYTKVKISTQCFS